MAKNNQIENNFLDGIDLGTSSTIKLDDSDLSQVLSETLNPNDEIIEIPQEDEDNNIVEASDSFFSKENKSDERLVNSFFEKDTKKNKPSTKEEEDSSEEEEEEDIDEANEDSNDIDGIDDIDHINTFNSLLKSLEKKGIMRPTNSDWKVESEDDLIQRFEYEGQMRASEMLDSLFSKYGENNRKFVEDIVLKGLDPFSYLESAKDIATLENLDVDDEDNLRQVYLEYEVQILGNSIDKAKKNLKRIEDSGDLEDEGRDAYEELKKLKEIQLERNIKVKEQEEKQKNLFKQQTKVAIESFLKDSLKTKNFDGVQVTSQDASDMMDYLTIDRYQLPDGSTISEFDKDLLELRRPENLKTKMKLALLLKNKLKLDRIKLDEKSNESTSLFNSLKRKQKQKNIGTKPDHMKGFL